MSQKVMTAPLALIKVNGITIGKMKNIRVTENIRRGRVSGIGELTPQELPALEWSGTMNAQFYNVNFKRLQEETPNSLDFIGRENYTEEEWVNNVLLQEEGLDIVIFKKMPQTVVNGIVTAVREDEFAQIKGCFMDKEGFDVSEGQVSGKDQDFSYLTPILFVD